MLIKIINVIIRSAYSFITGDDDDELSTRYITVTRTHSSDDSSAVVSVVETSDHDLLSTLHVETLTPTTGSHLLEVATIKSPYSFEVMSSV